MKRFILAALPVIFFLTAPAQPSVTIGTQTWMSHNLQVTTYRNGDPIPQVTMAQLATTTTGAWCYYNNDPANGPIYGKLYNWYAVHDPRGLAPLHWHVPSAAEWDVLTNFLGGPNIAGGKLKDRGTIWVAPNLIVNPDSYFKALPGGFCGNGVDVEKGASANFWTSTNSSSLFALTRILFFNSKTVTAAGERKNAALSVRCIADPVTVINGPK